MLASENVVFEVQLKYFLLDRKVMFRSGGNFIFQILNSFMNFKSCDES